MAATPSLTNRIVGRFDRRLVTLWRPVGVDLFVVLARLHICAAYAAEGHLLLDVRLRHDLDVAPAVGTSPDAGDRTHLLVRHVSLKSLCAFVVPVHSCDQLSRSGDSSERLDGFVAGVR